MTTNADGSPAGGAPAGDNPGATKEPGALPGGETKPEALNIEAKVEPPKTVDGITPVLYEPSGDVALDMALEFVGNLGFGPDDPVMKAAADGNFALLEAKLASMGDKAKGYEKFIALGKSAHANTEAKAKAEAAKNAEGIYSVVGGAANWKAINEWAGKNAEPAERATVNAALNAGGMQAKAMAYYLSTLYERAGNVVVKGKSAVDSGAANGGGGADSGALSPRAYTKEVDALRKKLGGRLDGSREYAQLQQRRNAWRG